MNPRNLTRKDIEQLNDIEPYCFETDREEQWFNIGLRYGLEVADSNPISPWISVEDDLPCNHKELIIDKETLPVISLLREGIICLNKMQKVNGDWCWKSDEPMYWFPIPKLPKEKK